MMKMGRDFPTVSTWVTENLPKGTRIAYDPALVNAFLAKDRTKNFDEKGYEFVPVPENLINEVWTDRPEMSSQKVMIHDLKYTGMTVIDKLNLVLSKITQKYLFSSVLDDIAWMLNLRGNDIDFNPLFFSYLLIDNAEPPAKLVLFINPEKVDNISDYLQQNNITIQRYDQAPEYLSKIEDEIAVDDTKLNFFLYNNIKKPVIKKNVIAKAKSYKNPTEINGFRDAYAKDGIALVKYISWLENQLSQGTDLNEWTAALKLNEFRFSEDLNMGLSFDNISSSGPNAAIIHYHPKEEAARKLGFNEIYLIDSGGQYLDGTTDTTRTMHFGQPTGREKECFTRVLLGNLDLERVKWPKNSKLTGNDLDILARRRLWEVGLDYSHGTGHGVGHFLNVHEGPHRLNSGATNEVFEVGMNITNEPGYYEEGQFGIRIENLLLVVDSSVPDYIEFENLTLVPYDKKLLDIDLLTKQDINYIDSYHQKVFQTLGPILAQRGEDLAYNWLKKATEPISLE